MAVNLSAYQDLKQELDKHAVTLVAVSKIQPVSNILKLYEAGQRDFGENYVQELVEKQAALPADIRWHYIGHLQSNKVKYIAGFVSLIHGVDSLRLLVEINKQALRHNRIIDCLLQVHIAKEDTKFGMDAAELIEAITQSAQLPGVNVRGVMGMASFSDDTRQVSNEFARLKALFDQVSPDMKAGSFNILSMGMSNDYRLAIEQGSTMVRIGSLLFGARA
jgi:pyridoxal phosphate enzyme (YggS family)